MTASGQSSQIKRVADTSARPPIASIRRQGGIDEKGHEQQLRQLPDHLFEKALLIRVTPL
jgi:hypothetical protein